MNFRASVLNPSSLDKLADELRKYADSMQTKIQQFLNALADVGITAARQHEGDYAGYIVYTKEPLDGYGISIIAKDRTEITNSWYPSANSTVEESDTFSPLLMAEYGSGKFKADDSPGLLPDSKGHGDDPNGWTWWSETFRDGQAVTWKNGRYLFRSYGTPPTRPMHEAVMEMIREVETIARSVFG